MTEIYKQTAEYARNHGEREAYRASLRANEACKEAIEAAIRKGPSVLQMLKEVPKVPSRKPPKRNEPVR